MGTGAGADYGLARAGRAARVGACFVGCGILRSVLYDARRMNLLLIREFEFSNHIRQYFKNCIICQHCQESCERQWKTKNKSWTSRWHLRCTFCYSYYNIDKFTQYDEICSDFAVGEAQKDTDLINLVQSFPTSVCCKSRLYIAENEPLKYWITDPLLHVQWYDFNQLPIVLDTTIRLRSFISWSFQTASPRFSKITSPVIWY